jgi:hypothetical protein
MTDMEGEEKAICCWAVALRYAISSAADSQRSAFSLFRHWSAASLAATPPGAAAYLIVRGHDFLAIFMEMFAEAAEPIQAATRFVWL